MSPVGLNVLYTLPAEHADIGEPECVAGIVTAADHDARTVSLTLFPPDKAPRFVTGVAFAEGFGRCRLVEDERRLVEDRTDREDPEPGRQLIALNNPPEQKPGPPAERETPPAAGEHAREDHLPAADPGAAG